MSNRKPDLRVFFKAVDKATQPQYVDLAAFWRENGRLGGGADRKIARLAVEFADGTRQTIDLRKDHRTHWLNVSEGSTVRGSAPSSKPAAGDDDIAF